MDDAEIRPNLGGYLCNLTRDKLDKAPKYTQSTGWNWTRENDQRVYDYYGASPYWGSDGCMREPSATKQSPPAMHAQARRDCFASLAMTRQ